MKDKSKRSLNRPMAFVLVCALVICGACAKKNENIVAFDDFDGKLNLDWQILNDDPSHYSLTKKPGTLTITTQKGGFRLSSTSYKNLFLIENPLANGKNFQLTTCLVSFKPSAGYQQAGLVCFNDPDNYLKWVDEISDQRTFTLIRETQGSVPPHTYVYGIPRSERLWLRITKRGDRYECSSSADGKSYRSHGEVPWGDGSPKWIGLVAKNGTNSSAPEIDASFDFFEVRSESIGVKASPPGEYAEVHRPQEKTGRERAMDRIVHIEQGIIRDIPQVPRLCDSMAIQKGKIDIGGCNLYCEQEGEGVPLVLINGGPGGTHHCFHPHFSRAKDFARIIYYDQRGCGLSDYRPDKGYTVDQAVDDLDRLRQALGIDQWVVLGFSYGGLLGQCYTTKYPQNVKGLVLVGSSMGFLDLSPSRDQEFISQQERDKLEQIRKTPGLSMAQVVYNLHLNGDWKRQSYYRPTPEDLARVALYEWVQDKDFGHPGPSENEVELLGAFKGCPIPTLILEGKWDMSWSADKPQRFHKNHPNARLVIFKESAHGIFEDEPEAFFAELWNFLSELPTISDNDLVNWKEYLVQYEKEKWQKIPEGPMTEQERAAIEEFHRIKAHIEKGQKYHDASIPLRSLLSLVSACANRDMEAVKSIRVFENPSDSRDFDFDSRRDWYSSLQIFRAPMPPKDAKEGEIWIIYTKEPNTSRLDDALLFVLWKGNWMHWGNMGSPDAAVQWQLITEEFKKRLLPLLKDQ